MLVNLNLYVDCGSYILETVLSDLRKLSSNQGGLLHLTRF